MSSTGNPSYPSSVAKPHSELPGEFGDLLFERKSWLLTKLFMPMGALGAVAGGVTILVLALPKERAVFLPSAQAGTCFVLAACLMVLTFHVWRAFLRVY